MGKNWNAQRSQARLATRYAEVETVSIVDYTKDTSLENIPVNKAYKMHAAHLYVDILNLRDMLHVTKDEGETCHKRTLRFLNLHYRAVHRILSETDARRVDFHNQRLHGVVAKPYGTDSERRRVERAVAIAQLIIDVLKETGDSDDKIPNAEVRVGIDTGTALAVNNGRRGGREPLFLGRPANQAAKTAGHEPLTGIYLTNEARTAIGLKALDGDTHRTTALTTAQIEACVAAAKLDVSKDDIVEAWKDEQKNTPIGSVGFSRPTPPLRDLDIQALSLANSKRFEAVSVYADIDGFSAYVENNIEDDPEDVVRALHVLRSELDHVVSDDFEGRRVRFIGDCIHGALLDGTAYTTYTEETVSNAVLCAGGLRSGFSEAKKFLKEKKVVLDDLGLAIGFEFGPLSISRLGMKGDMVRCAVGRNVLNSETEQARCDGTETAIGEEAFDNGSDAVRELFEDDRIVANLDYDSAVTGLAASDDKTAKAAQANAYRAAIPAVVPNLSEPLRPHAQR